MAPTNGGCWDAGYLPQATSRFNFNISSGNPPTTTAAPCPIFCGTYSDDPLDKSSLVKKHRLALSRPGEVAAGEVTLQSGLYDILRDTKASGNKVFC